MAKSESTAPTATNTSAAPTIASATPDDRDAIITQLRADISQRDATIAATVDATKLRPTIMFRTADSAEKIREKTSGKKPSYGYVARGDVYGVTHAALPVVIAGFTVGTKDLRTYTVFMPGSQYSKSLQPVQTPLDAGVELYDVDGARMTHSTDPTSAKALKRLEASVLTAWNVANADPSISPFDRHIALSL